MKRMKWWLLSLFILFLVFHIMQVKAKGGKNVKKRRGDQGKKKSQIPKCKRQNKVIAETKKCMQDVSNIVEYDNSTLDDIVEMIASMERALEETEVNETVPMSTGRLLVVLHKNKGQFKGLEFHASDKEARSDKTVKDAKLRVRLPVEVDPGFDNTVVFCMITFPEAPVASWRSQLYGDRLVGVSVKGKNVSGLQERVNITTYLTLGANQKPTCVFLDVSTKDYSSEGCQTVWGDGEVTCSCDHLTYFGVLMVPADVSAENAIAMSYITLIGCSLSLAALIITVLLFITQRKIHADVSMKVHISLAVALILLNLHFIFNDKVAGIDNNGLCTYMAVSLHYSLLATFTWMALEGFHIYILLVKVFNIYIRRYMLKLSLVGWGFPAFIVTLVVIIDRDAYGHTPLNATNTTMCYIRDETVKMVTTIGVFSVVFVYNLIMLGVAVQRVMCLHRGKEFGEGNIKRAKQNICTLLGLTTLLGISFCLIFLYFGPLSTVGLYLFAIFNSLQGFFIFLWFVMSLRKTKKSEPNSSNVTRSTNT